MKHGLRRATGALAATLGVAGGLAVLNRSLLLDDLPPTLPGAMHDWAWRGHRVRYTTLGSGPPVVLLHGIHAAASSFEMRQLFEPLSQIHTVYAMDWLGFGKSQRPNIQYDGHLYADLLADFLRLVERGVRGGDRAQRS
jgi:alpha-beta hydrolase superfamily lysophospholipase